MSAYDANRIADEKNLDLVKISPTANPPVCKLMDYGKYKFELSKKEKEAKKNQTVIEVKEIQLSVTIDKHDMETKAKHAQRFLEEGSKIKVVIRLRSRQNMHPEYGIEVMNKFYTYLEQLAKKDDKGIVHEGRNILMMLSPIKIKQEVK